MRKVIIKLVTHGDAYFLFTIYYCQVLFFIIIIYK